MSTLDRIREGNLRGSLLDRARRLRGRPRYLLPHTAKLKRRTSCRRLNELSARLGTHVEYLEIGVHFGLTLEGVRAAHRTGVDPAPQLDAARLPNDVDFSERPLTSSLLGWVQRDCSILSSSTVYTNLNRPIAT